MPTSLAGVNTLVAYFWMYGPERKRPCPMCTNLLGPLNANADDLEGSALRWRCWAAVRSKRQIAFGLERGWHHLPFYQTVGDQYALDFGGLDPVKGWEYPVLAVFRKDHGTVRSGYSGKGEMTGEMADKGKDPRGGPDLAPLWTVLDMTPEGRGEDWYPKLSYS